MSAIKEFAEFCRRHVLDPSRSTTFEFYRRDQKGLPWGAEEINECLDCGKHSLKVGGGKSYCFYCGTRGEHPGVELTPKQQQAEKQLREEKAAENREKALRIWDHCVPIGSNATVATYLGARRLSLELLPDPDRVMRWHGACPFGPGVKAPCIVSLFRSALTDQATAIHRTRIVSASEGRSERMAYGPFFGSAIKLWSLKKGEQTLAVGEGIESVLSAVRLGVADPPAWAATVAGNLSRLPVVVGVRRLTILADNDAHQKGQEHARALRRSWLDRGLQVAAKMPQEVGEDFNDVLRGRS